jgi:hypothetical protein
MCFLVDRHTDSASTCQLCDTSKSSQLQMHKTACCAFYRCSLCAGGELSAALNCISRLLEALHLSSSRPITDPQPALKLPPRLHRQERRSVRDTLGRERRQAGQQDGPQGYFSGLLWVPDTYSLGPAPAALAGVACMQQCMILNNGVRRPQVDQGVPAHGAWVVTASFA